MPDENEKKDTGGQPTTDEAGIEAEMLRMMASETQATDAEAPHIISPGEIDAALAATTPDALAAEKQTLAEREANLESRDQRVTEREESLRQAQLEFNDAKQALRHEVEQERENFGRRVDTANTQLLADVREAVLAGANTLVKTIAAARAEDNEAAKQWRDNEKAMATHRQETMTDHIRQTVRKYVVGGVAVVGLMMVGTTYFITSAVEKVPTNLIGTSVEEIAPKADVGELPKEAPAQKKAEEPVPPPASVTGEAGKTPAGGEQKAPSPAPAPIKKRYR